jgi:AcrR family transcriptional regulator
MDKKTRFCRERVKQRAGGVLEKSEKREQIIEMAESLMKGRDYNLPSVNEIISSLGIAKGTFYLYFKTKEEIYLSVLKKYHALLFNELEGVVRPSDSKEKFIDSTVDAMIAFAKRNPQAMYLSYISSIILENNLDLTIALDFKKLTAERMGRLIEIISEKYKIDPSQIHTNVIVTYNLWLSLWQYANPPANIEKLLQKKPLDLFLVPFADTFRNAVEKIWNS